MATAFTVSLKPGIWPDCYRDGITEDAAQRASEILQENHERHHCFWSPSGFHNHIAHQVLTLYALKATPHQLQAQYDVRKKRSIAPPDPDVVEGLHDPGVFYEHLGDESQYGNFLAFFELEIAQSSWQEVMQKYLFARTELAEALLVRMFAGFLHRKS